MAEEKKEDLGKLVSAILKQHPQGPLSVALGEALDQIARRAGMHLRGERVNLTIKVPSTTVAAFEKMVRAFYPGVPFVIVGGDA